LSQIPKGQRTPADKQMETYFQQRQFVKEISSTNGSGECQWLLPIADYLDDLARRVKAAPSH